MNAILKRRTLLGALSMTVAGSATLGTAMRAFAQTGKFPTKPLRLICPYSTGGGSDLVARLMAERMSASLGQQVLVDNRPGAGGNIGTGMAAKADPDGYTLVLASIASTANPSLYKSLPFEIEKDFEPIGTIASAPVFIVASANAPVSSFAELVSYAKSHPGALSYASSGNGTATHLAMEMLKWRLGLDIVHIPYKGSGSAVTDLVGGQLPLLVATPATVTEFVKDRRLKLLVTMGAHRYAAFPEVPTVAETLSGFEATSWLGIIAPRGTPPAVVQMLTDAMAAALKDPATVRSLDTLGFVPDYRNPPQMREQIATEVVQWARVVKAAGITL